MIYISVVWKLKSVSVHDDGNRDVNRPGGAGWEGGGRGERGRGFRGGSFVVRASEFKADDPGFDPLAGQGEVQFFCPSESTRVQTCLCLTPIRVYDTHPNLSVR